MKLFLEVLARRGCVVTPNGPSWHRSGPLRPFLTLINHPELHQYLHVDSKLPASSKSLRIQDTHPVSTLARAKQRLKAPTSYALYDALVDSVAPCLVYSARHR